MKTKTHKCNICWKEFIKYKSTDKFCSAKCKNKSVVIKEKEKRQKVREKKKVSTKVLYKSNLEMAKKIAKIRDGYICQRCWSTENIHWSHIINEARDHRLATNEYNIKALCYNCHMNFWHKDPLNASEWFRWKFPGRYEELQELHIQYSKMWSIWKEWHINENERLKKLFNN